MAEESTDVIQGTLDMLILKTLSVEPMHGFGVSRRIEQVSGGVFKVNPGSLLLAFSATRAGWRGRGRMARHREQSPRQVLPPDCQGTPETGTREP